MHQSLDPEDHSEGIDSFTVPSSTPLYSSEIPGCGHRVFILPGHYVLTDYASERVARDLRTRLADAFRGRTILSCKRQSFEAADNLTADVDSIRCLYPGWSDLLFDLCDHSGQHPAPFYPVAAGVPSSPLSDHWYYLLCRIEEGAGAV